MTGLILLSFMGVHAVGQTLRGQQSELPVTHLHTNYRISDRDLHLFTLIDGVTSVNLSGYQITDRGLRYLISAPTITTLDLSNTLITDQGIANISILPKVEFLDVSFNAQIGNESCQAI